MERQLTSNRAAASPPNVGRWLMTAVVVALGVFAVSQFTLVKEPVWRSPSGEATVNPYLALQRLLSELGINNTRLLVLDPDDFNAGNADTLVLVERGALAAPAAEWLTQWVQDGGHLLLTPDLLPNQLAKQLGVSLEYPEDEDGKAAAAEESVAAEPAGKIVKDAASDHPPWLLAPQPTTELSSGQRVQFLANARLGLAGVDVFNVVADQQGPVAARYLLGLGMITVAADLSPLTNGYLPREDNAAFALDLLSPDLENGTIWFALAIEYTPLWRLVLRYGWAVVAALLLGVALSIWRFWPRFGPPVSDRIAPRRSLAEHVRASGHYLWRSGEYLPLLDALRTATRSALQRQPGGTATAADDRLITTPDDPSDGSARRFVEHTQALQHTRKQNKP